MGEGDSLPEGVAVNLLISIFDGITQDIWQRVGGNDDWDILPSLLRVLMLGLADITLALKEKLGIIPRALVAKESGGGPLVDGDELWCLLDLVIIEIKPGSRLSIIYDVEDLAVHLELGSLTAVTDTPFPNSASLAFGFKQRIFHEVVDRLLVT